MLRHLPNLISVIRVLLVPPVVWLMVQGRFTEAAMLFVVAGASDGLDGFLAKHYGWTSRFGSIVDPLADKLLLTASFITLAVLGHLPLWLAGLVILRDVVIVVGALAYHYLVGRFAMDPSPLSKLNTFFQIALVALVLLDLSLWPVADWLITTMGWLLVATIVASGADYVWTWGQRAWGAKRQDEP